MILAPRFGLTMRNLALIVCLAPLAMSLLACLPFPVGNPEQSQLDPRLTGGWTITGLGGDGVEQLYVIRPFDAHTYLVNVYGYKTQSGVMEREGSGTYRAWLTKVGDTLLLTAHMKPIVHDLGIEESKEAAYWVVGKLSWSGDSELKLQLVRADSDLLKGVTTQEKGEPIIRGNIDNSQLYTSDPLKFERAHADQIKSVLELFKAG